MIYIRSYYFKFALLIFILNLFSAVNLHSYEIKIIQKIGDEIVTNIDIKKEYQYLIALNKDLKKIEKKKAYDIAKKSLITEKIKKNEILKFYILGKSENRLVKKILKGIYAPLGINNENEFVEYLKNYNLSLKEVSDKIEIEILWNKLIYSKYKNQININHESLKNKISVRDEEQKSYNLSEIVFLGDTKSEILNKHEKLKVHINELGFAKTALLYSQSDSNNKSGLLGWIYEGQLSQVFKDELKNLKKDQITKVLNVTGGALILKINDIKIERKKINLEVEMKKNVKFETEKQLNNFSLIYFNKVKNILVNEKN